MKQSIKQIKKPTIEDIIKAQEKFEKEFKKANRAEKRVMIAKDVIAQIKIKKFIPRFGTYFQFLRAEMVDNIEENTEVRDLINKPSEKCTVCALGGLFASCVRATDKLKARETGTWGSTMGSEILVNKLNPYFSLTQLSLIESAFEGSDFDRTKRGISTKEAVNFKKKLSSRSSANTMIAIMKNIIRNKGTFKP